MLEQLHSMEEVGETKGNSWGGRCNGHRFAQRSLAGSGNATQRVPIQQRLSEANFQPQVPRIYQRILTDRVRLRGFQDEGSY